MAKKVSTASVGNDNLSIAKEALKERQKTGMIAEDDIVLSIADHGDIIAVYTQTASFNVRKEWKKNGSFGKAG